MVFEYVAPRVAAGSVPDVVIATGVAGAGAMVTVNVRCDRFDESVVSVAATANVNVPATDGVPERTPLDPRLSPFGSEPLARLQAYDPVPPVAVSVAV